MMFVVCIMAIFLYILFGIDVTIMATGKRHGPINWVVFAFWPIFAIVFIAKKIAKDFQELDEMLFWRKKKCPTCEYLKSVSNHSPCHECVLGNKYKRYEPKPIIEILKEAGFKQVDMEGKYENTK